MKTICSLSNMHYLSKKGYLLLISYSIPTNFFINFVVNFFCYVFTLSKIAELHFWPLFKLYYWVTDLSFLNFYLLLCSETPWMFCLNVLFGIPLWVNIRILKPLIFTHRLTMHVLSWYRNRHFGHATSKSLHLYSRLGRVNHLPNIRLDRNCTC